MHYRKKFFILNEDVREALGGNVVLTELLYHQVRSITFLRLYALQYITLYPSIWWHY